MSKQNKPKRPVYNLEFKQDAAKLVIDIPTNKPQYNGKRTHSILSYQSPLEFEHEFHRKTV
jgi:hypothetical protein